MCVERGHFTEFPVLSRSRFGDSVKRRDLTPQQVELVRPSPKPAASGAQGQASAKVIPAPAPKMAPAPVIRRVRVQSSARRGRPLRACRSIPVVRSRRSGRKTPTPPSDSDSDSDTDSDSDSDSDSDMPQLSIDTSSESESSDGSN
jgi:hypothetical protein